MGDVLWFAVVITLFVYFVVFVVMDRFSEKSLAKTQKRKVIFLETTEN